MNGCTEKPTKHGVIDHMAMSGHVLKEPDRGQEYHDGVMVYVAWVGKAAKTKE